MSDTVAVRRHEHLMPRQKAEKKAKRYDCFRRYNFITIVLLFFIFAFIGWCWEVSLHIVKDHAFVNRGTMYGPWLPIYGCGGVLIIILLKKLAKNPVILFFGTVIVCGTIEYATSWYLEVTKGIKWWDYSNQLLNLNGRICAEGLIIFGLGGCVIVYVGAPFFAEKLDNLGMPLKVIAAILLGAAFLLDLSYSHEHPNTGKGITDYDTNTEARLELDTPLPSNLLFKR